MRSIDVVEIMDLVIGLFKISKMDEDMDKIVACVQVVFDDILADADARISGAQSTGTEMGRFLGTSSSTMP